SGEALQKVSYLKCRRVGTHKHQAWWFVLSAGVTKSLAMPQARAVADLDNLDSVQNLPIDSLQSGNFLGVGRLAVQLVLRRLIRVVDDLAAQPSLQVDDQWRLQVQRDLVFFFAQHDQHVGVLERAERQGHQLAARHA